MPTTEIDEKTFEMSFAEMALTSLKSKAPALVDYMMGFQLVDRSDDDTRAAGFFGFKVGPAWVYVPSIFASGEVKGQEMMYIKDQDLILPLEDGWVDYLIQRRPFVLGEGSERDVSQQGIAGPDLRRLRTPPSKTAADAGTGLHVYGVDTVATWAADGMGMFLEKTASVPSLPDFLAARGMTDSYIQLMRKNQKVAQATLKFYTVADLLEAQTKVAEVLPAVAASSKGKKPAVRILDLDTVNADRSEMAFLSDEEKKRLMTGQVLVDDSRSPDGVRRSYGIELTKTLSNPVEPGLYDVLNAGGDFTKMLVLIPCPVGGGGTRDLRLMIEPESGDYRLEWKTNIWVSNQYDNDELDEVLSSTGSAVSDTPSASDEWDAPRYVVVDAKGDRALGPFQVRKTISQSDTSVQWLVEPVKPEVSSLSAITEERFRQDGCRPPFEGPLFSEEGEIDLKDNGEHQYTSPCAYGTLLQIVISDKKLTKLVHGRGMTMVPRGAGFRLVKLGEHMSGVRAPGVQADLHMRIGKFAEVVKLYSDGLQLNIVSDDIDTTIPVTSQKRAYEVLMRDLGLGASDAEEMLKTASERTHKANRYYVFTPEAEKTAAPFDQVGQTGIDPWLGVPIQDSDDGSFIDQLPEHQAQTDDQAYRHQPGENDAFEQYYKDDMARMEQAAETGQKDVFDAGALGSLINTQNVGDEIDSYVPNLISAVDKLGRTLFLIYWHSDEIQERYGQQEVKNLEDNVKSVFSLLGETVLDLKKQSPADEDFLSGGGL